MEEIARLDHVYQYNELMGIETLHPLVSVIDMSKCPRMRHSRRLYGFYCIFLKDVKCGDLRYGRNYYDYQEGTLVFTAPGQVVGVEDNGAARRSGATSAATPSSPTNPTKRCTSRSRSGT